VLEVEVTGYKDVDRIKQDALDVLRERDDFKALLKELEAKQSEPPEKR
jgi:hypothetical protein